MSRNEGEEEERHFVLTVILSAKAHFLQSTTVVREGMSVDEDRVMGNTLQSDVTRIIECTTVFISSECCEFRQVYSSVRFIIITSHYQFT